MMQIFQLIMFSLCLIKDSRSPYKKLPNPPKTDVTNPKNKYCLPCNRDFNRRQAFVEHCRNVHNMKIKLSKPVPPGAPSSVRWDSTEKLVQQWFEY